MTEDLLRTLRESIQQHRRISWLFSGSHDLLDLPHVRWTSYLVNARTVEVAPFSPEETRLLLTQPLEHSTRPDVKAAGQATFGAAFWGERGMEIIHEEAGGWPHLVQAIAATIVDLCNLHGRAQADPTVIEEAIAKTIVSSETVLADLMLYNSTKYPEAWEYLARFRTHDRLLPPENDALRRRLKRYLLVRETEDGQWQLSVPLMLRWLRKRA